ncbi:GcrA family cell cycle regulator [Mesorhizobium sp.]|uniref:GcrA family cell cycle regulator n=1 Tax=Mesorhizobium sp. TaxID=1871066 RepID=UPI000FE35B2E|nr:GcrA family cell cycle regulator [Mesorhizobium sp.]RWQ12372.1 MAG: hypothetical protein EOR91_01265 [Mesorhizobium sp.]
MASNASSYSAEEILAIAGWLRDGLSASQVAGRLATLRRRPVSRNAIVGIVHRNKTLAAIGFSGAPCLPSAGSKRAAKPAPKVAGPRLHAGNIRGKKEARALDPVFAPPRPRPVDDSIPPRAYDAAARHVPLEELRHGECRWPVNDAAHGEQHLFCGKASGFGSYCPHHARRAGARPQFLAEAA